MLSKLLERHIPVDIDKLRNADFLESQRKVELEKMDRVTKGHGWKRVPACPVCGHERYKEELEKHGIPLVQCKNCELRFHTKIAVDPNDVYQNSSYTVYTKEDSEEHFQYRKERFGKERIKLLEHHCGDLSEKKLLDVGCGNGYFLSAAREKCGSCIGLELSAHLAEIARKNSGVPVYCKLLTEFPDADIDIITAFDIIEHVQDPLQFMRDAARHLKVGGCILLYTPNFDSLSVKVLREYSSIVDGSEHVILFNHSSLEELGKMAGLKVVYAETRGLDIHSILAFQSCLGEEPNAFLSRWLNELQAMVDASGCGDYLRVIYRKI